MGAKSALLTLVYLGLFNLAFGVKPREVGGNLNQRYEDELFRKVELPPVTQLLNSKPTKVVEETDRSLEESSTKEKLYKKGLDNKLEVQIEKVKELNTPFEMKVTAQRNQEIDTCYWKNPSGQLFQVKDGKVVDMNTSSIANGIVIPELVDNSSSSCAILIKHLKEEQLGVWECKVKILNVDQFQVARLSVFRDQFVTGIRLPTHVIPIDYTVFLAPFIKEGNFTIDGNVTIELKVEETGSHNITLHAKDMEINEDEVKVKGGQNQSVVGHGYDPEREFYIVFLKNPVQEGQSLTLDIPFTADLSDGLHGFYRSKYTDDNGLTRWIATTQFEPADARKALPCFDEPIMKATFSIRLGRIANMTSLSNMPKEGAAIGHESDPEYVWDVYKKSVNMSTYLLAFIVSDFGFKDGIPVPGSLTEFKVWARKSALDQTEFAARIGPDVLHYYESFFSVEFPLPKQDMIGIPDFAAGAMENWGLITYRESDLLYEEGVSSLRNRERVALVISHELAHQWFGNLVTMEWWTDLWLNEGFANYVENIGITHVLPDSQIHERFVIDTMYTAFEFDGLESSHPVSMPDLEHPKEIENYFDTISYNKGATIIRMMTSFLGEDTFHKGLTNYLIKHRYSNAKKDDLWASMTEVAVQDGVLSANMSVKMIMDTWTLQMGYPVVTVKNAAASDKVTFSQNRFLNFKDSAASDKYPADYLWWIPITVSWPGRDFEDTKPIAFMEPKEAAMTVTLADNVPEKTPLIVNVLQTGYYRVNYEQENWNLIGSWLQTGNTEAIPQINRAQILNDALSLARVGLLDYQTALDQTKYLAERETQYVPWSSGLSQLNKIKNWLRIDSNWNEVQNYLVSLMRRQYNDNGFAPGKNDSYTQTLLTTTITNAMCKLGHIDCIDRALDLFDAWVSTPMSRSYDVTDDNNPIPSDMRPLVYCMGVQEGGEQEWDFVWQQMIKVQNENEKRNMRSALACSKELWLLKRYMERSIAPASKIRRQDSYSVISYISGNVYGQELAWRFVRDNWDQMDSIWTKSDLSRILGSVTEHFTTSSQLEEFERFVETNKQSLGPIQSLVDKAKLTIKQNIAWTGNYRNDIVKWFKEQNAAATRSY